MPKWIFSLSKLIMLGILWQRQKLTDPWGDSGANLNPHNLMKGRPSPVSCLHPCDLSWDPYPSFLPFWGLLLDYQRQNPIMGDTSQWEPMLHLWCMEHPFLLDWPNRNKVSLAFGEACSSVSASWQLREVAVGWEGADAQRKVKLRGTLRHLTIPLELSCPAVPSILPFSCREANVIPLFLAMFWVGLLSLEAQRVLTKASICLGFPLSLSLGSDSSPQHLTAPPCPSLQYVLRAVSWWMFSLALGILMADTMMKDHETHPTKLRSQ